MKSYIYVVIAVIAVSVLSVLVQPPVAENPDCQLTEPYDRVTINEAEINVKTVTSNEQQQKGLAGCENIPNDTGMLFPYAPAQNVGFWMKGMLVPIDIVWIADGVVVGIEERTPPPGINVPTSELPVYRPPQPVTAVLELKAGRAQELNIQKGSILEQQ